MKYIITAFIAACAISSCQSYTPPADAVVNPAQTEAQKQERMKARILGTYKGDFGGSPIYITINYCSNNKLAGYDTHKGLRRNLSGTITDKGLKYAIQLSEPGDHEFDGVFSLIMDTSLTKASGSWKPTYNKSLTEKQLSITRLKWADNNLGFLSGDHCDIYFEADGICTLNYYEKTNDSSFSPQMNTLRGTWETQPNKEVLVNWQPNPVYRQRATTFTAVYDTNGRGVLYPITMKGDIFEFCAEGVY